VLRDFQDVLDLDEDVGDCAFEFGTPTQRSPVLRRRANLGSSAGDPWPRETMNKPFDRITVDPKVMNGRPCIRGMRLTVRRAVEAVALYPDRSELRQEYPELEDDDIRQALEFAAGNLDDEILMLEAG
jgi:uncharacterized protein (DUF433 family)